jgi:TRAP-type C4-dicarboxylate transport system permease small subunit
LIVSGVSAAVLVLLTAAGVFMRYVVNSPFTWLEEVQMILFVWSAFFGASVAFRCGGHIAIEILADMLPRAVQAVLERVVFALVVLALVYMMYLQTERGFALIRTGRSTSILNIPQYLTYFGVSLACFLMTVHLIIGRFKK